MLEASIASSSLVFERCTSTQATQTQLVWSAQSRGFESEVWFLDRIMRRVLATHAERKTCLKCRVQLCGV